MEMSLGKRVPQWKCASSFGTQSNPGSVPVAHREPLIDRGIPGPESSRWLGEAGVPLPEEPRRETQVALLDTAVPAHLKCHQRNAVTSRGEMRVTSCQDASRNAGPVVGGALSGTGFDGWYSAGD